MTKLAASTSIGAHDDWWRDYPLSLAEMKNLFEICGFGVATEDYAKSDHPLKDYFASFAATPGA